MIPFQLYEFSKTYVLLILIGPAEPISTKKPFFYALKRVKQIYLVVPVLDTYYIILYI